MSVEIKHGHITLLPLVETLVSLIHCKMEAMEDYEILAERYKDEGNVAFQLGTAEGVKRSIELYSQAIELDPDNKVYYSNRSAAYIKADSKSKALWDAEKCIDLAPDWVKGYSRLGAAQQSLKRFEAAIETFKKAVELDPQEKVFKGFRALRNCQEAYEIDKKKRHEEDAKKRAYDEEQQQLREAAIERAKTKTLEGFVSKVNEEIDPDENLLNEFFSEINHSEKEKEAQKNAAKIDALLQENPNMYKYATEDLGDPVEQVNRLTAPNYDFKNVNPYEVFQMDIDATDEDIKHRYRKLSAKVHPDKLIGVENAREAFEQVKKAYAKLTDPEQKKNIISNIEQVREDVARERKRLMGKGAKEGDLLPIEDEIKRKTLIHFADIEMAKRRSEHCLRAYNARERLLEDAQKEKEEIEKEFEKEWAEVDRRENRVGNWRSFQENPLAKKARTSSYKEETRKETKFGVVNQESWKKSWK